MKIKLHSLFVVLTHITIFSSGMAQPTLSIAPASSGTVLFWITTATNYVLQSTTNLASPNWMIVSNAQLVNISNAMPVSAVSVYSTSSTAFFRLFQNTNTPITTTGGMNLIPGGSFIMGDTLDGLTDSVPISITVSPFYMDSNLVSYVQWQSIYDWATNQGYGFVNPGAGKGTNYAVQTVDWYDAVKWSNARSQQAGLTPIYYTDNNLTQIYTNGETTNVFPNWTANGYRLPTEAEYEKAERGGLSGLRFPWGNTIDWTHAAYNSYWVNGTHYFFYDLAPQAGRNPVFETGPLPDSSPLGYFAPNGFGLYDMSGNEEVWVWDWYGTPYGQPTAIHPTGPATGSTRARRAGNWNDYADYLRCAQRYFSPPTSAGQGYGFRCVRGL